MAIKKRIEPPVDVFVQPGETAFLTIIIGNAQIGGSIVKFKDSSTVFAKGKIKDLEIGKAEDLVGKTLKITTNVLDSNTATDKISVTHNFKNGTPASFPFFDSVDNAGDIFSLITEYNFKK
jgi:hypothetical protein